MSVLGREQIKDRSEDLFLTNYDPKQVQPAAYELQAATTEAKIGDMVYTMDSTYREDHEKAKRKGYFELPARRISVISSKEELSLPDDICARVGIRLTFSKEGLIPLFGPQIDPGYQGRFYAVIYNASGEPVDIHQNDEAVFKMVFQNIEGSKVNDVDRNSIDYITDLEISDLDDGITSLSDIKAEFSDDLQNVENDLNNNISDVDDDLTKRIEEIETDVSKAQTTVDEVKTGYRQVVLFGVFLLATSAFGVVYTILLDSVQTYGFDLGPNFSTIFTGLFLAGWLLGISVLMYEVLKSDND